MNDIASYYLREVSITLSRLDKMYPYGKVGYYSRSSKIEGLIDVLIYIKYPEGYVHTSWVYQLFPLEVEMIKKRIDNHAIKPCTVMLER